MTTGLRNVNVALLGAGRPYRPFAFDGGLRTDCRLLDGPIRDMNMIFDDVRVNASVDIRMPGKAASLDFGVRGSALLHSIRSGFEAWIDGRNLRLQPGDTLRVDAAAGETLATTALDMGCVLAWMAIRHRQ